MRQDSPAVIRRRTGDENQKVQDQHVQLSQHAYYAFVPSTGPGHEVDGAADEDEVRFQTIPRASMASNELRTGFDRYCNDMSGNGYCEYDNDGTSPHFPPIRSPIQCNALLGSSDLAVLFNYIPQDGSGRHPDRRHSPPAPSWQPVSAARKHHPCSCGYFHSIHLLC